MTDVPVLTVARERKMIESSGFNTPRDMGVRLLAHQINKNKSLFLWWD